jgi:hypothetical protein
MRDSVEPHLTQGGALGLGRQLEPDRRDVAIGELADTFEVNPAVVRIRLQELYPIEQGRQLTL